MKEKQHIMIRIADVAPISLDVAPDREADVRQTAANVHRMWAQLSKQFPDKSSPEILAMVAFRYAQIYYELVESNKAHDAALAQTEQALDKILQDIK